MSLNIYLEATTNGDELRKEVALALEKNGVVSSRPGGGIGERSKKMNFKTNDDKEILKLLSNATGAQFEIVQKLTSKDAGGYSDTFTTYKFKLKKSFGKFKANESFLIANAQSTKEGSSSAISHTTPKSLTPKDLKLTGVAFKKPVSSLIVSINKAIEHSHYDAQLKKVLKSILRNLENSSILQKAKKNNLPDIQDGDTDVVIFDKSTIDAINLISTKDLDVIGKNFGEVLDGVYMFMKYGIDQIEFPSAANIKLVDLVANKVIYVSSKYKGGASPSITSMTDKIQEDPKAYRKNDAMIATVSIIEAFSTSSILSSFLTVMEIVDTNIWRIIRSSITKARSITNNSKQTLIDKAIKDALNKFILDKYEQFGKDANLLHDYLVNKIWKHARDLPNVSVKDLKVKIANKVDMAGLIMYPAQSELIGKLNDPTRPYLKALSSIAQTMGVKQIYLDVTLTAKTQQLRFRVKDFTSHDFMFDLNNSINNYTNSRVAFRMK